MRTVWLTLILLLGLSVWNYHRSSLEALSLCSKSLNPQNGVSVISGRLEKRNPIVWELNDSSLPKPEIRLVSQKIDLAEYWGKSVRVIGRLNCSLPPENPSFSRSFTAAFPNPIFSLNVDHIFLLESGSYFSVKSRFERWLQKSFSGYPALLTLERALWFGDMSGFSDGVKEFYLAGGSLAVLALSGQHVAGLFILVETLFTILVFFLIKYMPPRRKRAFPSLLKYVKNVLPFFCSASLLYTSGFSPSMVRTTSMVFSLCLIRFFGISSGIFQVLATSTALMVSWNPVWILNAGFILSIWATLLIFVLCSGNLKEGLRHYLMLSLLFPLLMFPCTSYYFSKFSLSSLVVEVPLSILWDFFIVPIGFFLPLCGLLGSGAAFLFLPLEKVWSEFLAIQAIMGPVLGETYFSTIRVNDAELFLLQCISLSAVRYVIMDWKKESEF